MNWDNIFEVFSIRILLVSEVDLSSSFMLGLFFYTEDGSDMFLRNLRLFYLTARNYIPITIARHGALRKATSAVVESLLDILAEIFTVEPQL
jgi:hypothetical protein